MLKEISGKFRETEGMEPKEGMFFVCLILTENSTKILNFEWSSFEFRPDKLSRNVLIFTDTHYCHKAKRWFIDWLQKNANLKLSIKMPGSKKTKKLQFMQ